MMMTTDYPHMNNMTEHELRLLLAKLTDKYRKAPPGQDRQTIYRELARAKYALLDLLREKSD